MKFLPSAETNACHWETCCDSFIYTHFEIHHEIFAFKWEIWKKCSTNIAIFMVQVSSTWNSITITSNASWNHSFTEQSPSSA